MPPLDGDRFILVQARWMTIYDAGGKIATTGRLKRGSRILSSKRDSGLGILSIKRILNQPGDEFDVDYNDTTFSAMVKIVDRAWHRDVLSGSFPAQDKIKSIAIFLETMYNGS